VRQAAHAAYRNRCGTRVRTRVAIERSACYRSRGLGSDTSGLRAAPTRVVWSPIDPTGVWEGPTKARPSPRVANRGPDGRHTG
jgi:hypothetical protein